MNNKVSRSIYMETAYLSLFFFYGGFLIWTKYMAYVENLPMNSPTNLIPIGQMISEKIKM